MKSAIKIPLQVSPEQAVLLDSQSKIANWLYNKLLETANDLRQQYRAAPDQEHRNQIGLVLYTERGLRNLIPGLKREHPFLKVVYSSVLKNAALRLSKAIRDYQDGKHGRRANQVNWPRFRAWKRNWFSLQYDEPHKGYRLAGRTLTLVLGQDFTGNQLTIEVQLAQALPHWVNYTHIRQCRIVKAGHRYSVVFSVQRVLPNGKPLRPDNIVALDPNHKNCAYAVGSDGKATEIHNPYFLKILDKRIDQLKSKRDKCKKKSRRITVVEPSLVDAQCAPARPVPDSARTDQAVPVHGGQSTLSRLRCGRHRGLCPTRRRPYQKDAPRHEQPILESAFQARAGLGGAALR